MPKKKPDPAPTQPSVPSPESSSLSFTIEAFDDPETGQPTQYGRFSRHWQDEEALDVLIDKLADFKEAGACGTAAVISPIGGIQYNGKLHVFHSETEVGPITQKLYKELTGVQTGDVEAPEGWIVKV